jgi:hypothetical protein
MLLGSFGLAACDSRPSLVPPQSEGTLLIKPTVASEQGLQAVVKEYQASDIHRVEIIPYMCPESGPPLPLSKLTGEPTTADDPEIIKIALSSTELNEGRSVALSGLRRHQTYRLIAHAYTVGGQEISNPWGSSVDVQVSDDDRPKMATVLPIGLLPKTFSGTMPLELALSDPAARVDHLVLTIREVMSDMTYTVAAPLVISRQDLPGVITLLHLKARTSYQLEVKARPSDPMAPVLGVETLTWRMEDDDEAATRSVSVVVPESD